ncbi:Crp/Fnr family transcriptional regulator [Sulfitobacter aestuarii]|uniref:Crp/Fnr family transcriptional regulator n=1 Tax=Sulfitobacter aestuarii TaxID=2161676 RepID=A0ABW5U609_9RHOB
MSCLPHVEYDAGSSLSPVALRAALRRWDVAPVSVPPRCDIQHEGERVQALYLVESGWLFSYSLLSEGQRQILGLYRAGDIAGLADVGAETASCSLRSLRSSVLQPIPLAALASPAFLSPQVAGFLLQKSAQAQQRLMRTLVAVGQMDARQRIVWLILTLHHRLHGEQNIEDTLEIPLNQSEIGDLLGLTNVTVSKALCQLAEQGFIARRGNRIALLRPAELRRMIGQEPSVLPADIIIEPDQNARRSRGNRRFAAPMIGKVRDALSRDRKP